MSKPVQQHERKTPYIFFRKDMWYPLEMTCRVESAMTISPRAIEAAARAIIKARQEWRDREGPFGVYYLPYSVAGQHAVRDFRPGAEAKIVSRFDTHEEAMAECALLTEQHFLAAALAVDGLCLVEANEVEKLRSALKGLSDMYTHAWDLADGGLMMMESSMDRFEKAHQVAYDVLNPDHPLISDEDDEDDVAAASTGGFPA